MASTTTGSVPVNIVDVESAGDLAIHQLPTPGLGDSTYLLRCGGESAIVDPQCDLDRLEAALRAVGGRLMAVLETHIHNDYVSGGYALAQRHHATYCVPSDAGYRVEHRPMADGDEIAVGQVRLRALHTPGHTPHHTSYAVLDTGDRRVVAVFSGGCLLLGACGRTDLVSPDLTEELTRAQYRSAGRIAALGDPTAVAPTHGAGSFCAASAAAAETWTTVARERTRNPAFLAQSEEDFVRGQLSGLLAYPAYYAHMAELNRSGGAGWEPRPPPMLEPGALERLVAAGTVVIDGRPRHAFAAGHIPGTVNVELDPSFGSYVGWLVPFGSRLAFVLGPDQDPLEAVRQCARIGIETVDGVLADGVEAWVVASGRGLATYPVTDVAGMEAAGRAGGVRLLDVRQEREWDDGRVPGAIHIHVPDLAGRVGELGGSGEPVYVCCRTGHRAAMAASVVDAAGLPAVLVDGGFPDWVERGFPVEAG
jgi:hydroxyacylglutathione hydrolase